MQIFTRLVKDWCAGPFGEEKVFIDLINFLSFLSKVGSYS